ncbi:methyltransferase, FxLD system [Longispora sp. NPDC051575]|uniref:methyltransferase, FxLD system n=1 Tax=Longispora sp. NPDC051575 TaxID=3154943 RepID=UPI00341213D8
MDLDFPPEIGPASPWRQTYLTFADWRTAEHYAAKHLGPALLEAEDNEAICAFMFLRKGATWRLRVLPGDDPAQVDALLEEVSHHEKVLDSAESWYAPPVGAFGGSEGLAIAHALAHADSRHILAHLAAGGDHRRELGVLLATRLMRAAGMDWYDQGEVWRQVALHRDDPQNAAPSLGAKLVSDMQRFLVAAADAPGSPLYAAPTWPAAHERAGQALGYLHAHGELSRDLTGVVVHVLLHVFNRLGISAADQAAMASAAEYVVFHRPLAPGPQTPAPGPGTRPARRDNNQKADTVTKEPTKTHADDAARLRDQLADTLKERGYLTDPRVEHVLRTVPREPFLPGVALADVYAPTANIIKRDETGAALSSASGPNLVSGMLHQLKPEPGQMMLEIGTATAVNAAYLFNLVQPGGRVVTIEIDQDLTDIGRANLERAGYPDITVICGDGALGYPDGAPYDGLVVTAGAWDVSAAWWAQVRVGGRIVVPLRLHECGLTRSLAFIKVSDDQLVSDSALVCGFVPMRGLSEHLEDHLRLGADVVLKLDPTDQPDRDALAGVLDHPRQETWTSIHITDADPVGHLDLYMLVHAGHAFGRLGVGAVARETGKVNPAYRWNGAVIYSGGTIAYPAFQATSDTTYNLGVIAHGPEADKLGADLLDLLHRWDETGRPNDPTVTARPTTTGPAQLGEITRPDSIFSIQF